MRTLGVVVGVTWGLALAGAAQAQDENPTTPGAIPNPGSYQGSMELQRQSDQQDQQFRQQQSAPQYSQPSYSQPSYSTPQYSAPQRRASPPRASSPPRAAALTPAPTFEKLSPGDKAAQAALDRGDWAGAVRIWRPLAEGGEVNAEYNLGVMYDLGHGVPKDDMQAAAWYRKAANAGMGAAMVNLADLLALHARNSGELVPAYRWLKTAELHVSDPGARANARHNMALLAPHMSPAQIAQAETAAREWRAP